MTEDAPDPLAVIAKAPPVFSKKTAAKLLNEYYGLKAALSPLISERDQNFRVDCDDGRQFVLKIANAAEDSQVTDFQINALLHIEEYLRIGGLPVQAPRVGGLGRPRSSRTAIS